MKRLLLPLILIQIVSLLFPFNAFCKSIGVNTPSPNVSIQLSEAELTTRFTDILNEELPSMNVVVTNAAASQLKRLIRTGAATVVREKAFDRVPEAEANIRRFAEKLLENGTRNSGRITITPRTINRTLGLCPLFPICK